MSLKEDINGIVKSIGLVFGDIGTSPIYTFSVIFLFIKPTTLNIMGALSLIFWTMTILVTLAYSWLAMSLSKKGEGGTIVLKEILSSYIKSPKKLGLISILTFIGISLLIGDCVITPAISILSAVEGIRLIPGNEQISQHILIIIAAAIAIGLFSIQKSGTEKVAGAFGPLMVIWFTVLAASGAYYIHKAPFVLKAINPIYAFEFLTHNGIAGFFVLSSVILCATGGEALYTDMGHLGRLPVIRAWGVVFIALVINYFGQGAYLIHFPNASHVLFEMVNNESHIIFIPFLTLTMMASIIASQAMISGIFSIIYQGITTRIMPLFRVDYTSPKLRAQIYIEFANWFLMIFVLVIMVVFQSSSHLATAYGLAVNGSMFITAILMLWIFIIRKCYIKATFASIVLLTNIVFLAANTHKFYTGGYWSVLIALIPFLIILIYTNGQKKLYKCLKPIEQTVFLDRYVKEYEKAYRIRGTALFFIRDTKMIPPYIANTMFNNGIIYEDNIFVSIFVCDQPFGVEYSFEEDLAIGLRHFKIKIGYMEVIDVEKLLAKADIQEKVIFYGLEDIITHNPIWKLFSFIKKNTPTFVQFYALPSNKLHGVITRVELK